MLLNAVETASDPNIAVPGGTRPLRWTFYIATTEDMRFLGQAFARAALPQENETGLPFSFAGNPLSLLKSSFLRIGLCSGRRSRLGKSTFTDGILSTVADRRSIQHSFFVREQNVWHSPTKGWIRHYDCFCRERPGILPSYRKNDIAGFGSPLTDIVEHPYDDRHDKEFDCLVFFDRKGRSNIREVTITLTQDMARSAKFHAFIKECGHLMRPEQAEAIEQQRLAQKPQPY